MWDILDKCLRNMAKTTHYSLFSICKTRSYEPILYIISSWIYTFFLCFIYVINRILCDLDSTVFNSLLDSSGIFHGMHASIHACIITAVQKSR